MVYLLFVGQLGIGFVIYIIGFFLKRSLENIEILCYLYNLIYYCDNPFNHEIYNLSEFDMLKFFYYLIPIICVLLGSFLFKNKQVKLSINCIYIDSGYIFFNIGKHVDSFILKQKQRL